MIRRDFLRNSLMALAVSLVPKILQPVDPIEEGYIGIIPQLGKQNVITYRGTGSFVFENGKLVLELHSPIAKFLDGSPYKKNEA